MNKFLKELIKTEKRKPFFATTDGKTPTSFIKKVTAADRNVTYAVLRHATGTSDAACDVTTLVQDRTKSRLQLLQLLSNCTITSCKQ